jgi:hypothetical protein
VSTTEPDDVRARVALILAASGADGLDGAVERLGHTARERAGASGAVRVGVRAAEDPLSATMGERGALEPVDAVLEVTAAEGVAPADVGALVAGARDALGDAIDPERSTVIAGPCYRFLSGPGQWFIALAGYRDAAISSAQLTEWWLRHGPLALSLVRPLPTAYEQLHGDGEASEAAAIAAGLPSRGYDMYDTIAIESVADLQGSVMDPEVAVALYEDEVGHVDHATLRGALQRVVAA